MASIFSIVKSVLKKEGGAECPRILESKRLINRLREEIDYLLDIVDEEVSRDYRSLLTSLIREKCENIEVTKASIRYHKRNQFRALNEMSKILMSATSLEVAEQIMWTKVPCRIEHHMVRRILTNIRQALQLRRLTQKQKDLRRQARLAYIKSHRHDYSILQIEECSSEEDYSSHDVSESVSDSELLIKNKKKNKTRFIFSSQLCAEGEVFVPPKAASRDADLILKLKSILKSFKLLRSKGTRFNARTSEYIKQVYSLAQSLYIQHSKDVSTSYSPSVYQPCEEIEMAEIAMPQMDAHQVSDDGVMSQDQAGNVVLTEARITSSDSTTVPRHNWCNYVSSDIVGNYHEMTDRWLKFYDFNWSVNGLTYNNTVNPVNQFAIDLPYDVIHNDNWSICDMPNTLPFKVHRYWRGDMVVKVQLNSNKFQIGQLQIAWLYEPDADKNADLRANIYSLSQTSHVLINASSSNEVEMTIPFKYHLPMLHTRPRSDIDQELNMGRLYFNVMNPLSVNTNGPKECTGSIFIKFMNNEFTGQLSGALPQMDTMAKAALGALNAVAGCPNEDNPPDTRAPRYLVPTASHSWANGIGLIEPLHSLRLDAKGRTPHPDHAPDEMELMRVARIFGLVNQFAWTTKMRKGERILSFDAAPLLTSSSYHSNTSSDSDILSLYYIPPVGVVSSLYNYWRGPLEFRFDFVASQFHTGRVVVGYVPGALSSTNVELSHILAGPHVVFTLQELQQLSYVIPYIANKPYWNRRYMGNYVDDQQQAPSRIYMFVLNPLVIMQDIIDKVYINVYMRAAEGFEVAIPVQPSLGTGFFRRVLYSDSQKVYPIPGYNSYYVGVWRNFNNARSNIFRYGTTSDSLTHFDSSFLKKTTATDTYYYEIENINAAPKYWDGSQYLPVRYMCLVYQAENTQTYALGIPMESIDHAKSFSVQYAKSHDWSKLYQYCMAYLTTSGNTTQQGNPGWIAKLVPVTRDGFEFVLPQGERDEASFVIDNAYGFSNTGFGFSLFGENFSNLKDLCRRYQVYASMYINVKSQSQIGQCSYIIPLMPQALDLQMGVVSKILEISNRCRDGHIPIIASGYRYYRGSLRFRLVFPPVSASAWIQHRPDRKLRRTNAERCDIITTGQAVANHTYATYIQDLSVNSIVEFEIPYYQNAAYGLLQRPNITNKDRDRYFSLGELTIGILFNKVDTKDIVDFPVTMYYSVGDDMQFSTFQGYPPVVMLDDIASAVPQMGLWSNVKKGVVTEVKQEVTKTVEEQTAVVAEKIETRIEKALDYIKNTSFSDIVNTSFIRNFFSNIVHLIANFNWKSMAISIFSILVEVGIFSMQCITSFLEIAMKFFKNLSSKVQVGEAPQQNPANEPVEQAEVAVPQGETADDATIGFVTLIWAGVCSLVSGCSKGKIIFKDMSEFSKFLTKDIKGSLSSANVVFTFVKNLFACLDAMKLKVLGLIRPDYVEITKLGEEYAFLEAWTQECLQLCDPVFKHEHLYELSYRNRVDLAHAEGSLLMHKTMSIKDNQVTRLVDRCFSGINSVREELVINGLDSFIRKEPFVLWQFGDAGVGKSTIANQIAYELLAHRKIKINTAPVYVHEASSDFWDSCIGNPVMLVDDMFNVQSGEILEKHLSLLFSVVSPVVLCPPKARLEDKGRPYNPEIFFINSNYDYVRFNGVHEAAIHRRRHVLFRTSANPHKKPGCDHCEKEIPLDVCPAELLEDNHHLLFQVAPDVNTQANWDVVPYLTYVAFINKLKKLADVIMEKNYKLYKKRCEEMDALLHMDEIEEDDSDFLNDLVIKYQNKRERMRQDFIDKSVKGMVFSAFKDANTKVKDIYDKVGLTLGNFFSSSAPIVAIPQGDFTPPYFYYNHRRMKDLFYATRTTSLLYQEFYIKKMSINTLNIPRDNQWSKYAEDNVVKKLCDPVFFARLVALMTADPKVIPEEVQEFTTTLCFLASNSKFKKLSQENFLEAVLEAGRYMPDYEKCQHRNIHPKDVYIEKCKFKVKDIDGYDLYMCDSTHTSTGKCLWDNSFYKFLFIEEFLKINPRLKFKWNMKKRVNAEEFPHELFDYHNYPLLPKYKFIEIITGVKETILDSVFKLYDKFKNFWCYLKESRFFIDWILGIVLGASILIPTVGTGLVFYELYQDVKTQTRHSKPIQNWSHAQSMNYDPTPKQSVNMKVPVAKPQSNAQQYEVAINRIFNNMFQITALFGDRMLKCHGVNLGGRKILLLRHYLEEFSKLPPNTIYYGKYHLRNDKFKEVHGLIFQLRDCNVQYYKSELTGHQISSNYVILTLPKEFMECKSIIPFIASQNSHQLFRGDAIMIQNTGRIIENLHATRARKPMVIGSLNGSTEIVLQDMYEYKLQKRGMCGSLLLGKDLERPILGIHVAGVEVGNERGIAEILVNEIFEEVKLFDNSYDDFVLPIMTDAQFSKLDIDTLVYPLGCSDKTIYQSGKTQIVPSLIHSEVLPVVTEPAPLSQHDPRFIIPMSPLKEGVQCLGKPPITFPMQLLDMAAEDFENKILTNVTPLVNVSKKSLQTVICGDPDIPFFDPLEWSTSPGYPLRLDKDNERQTGKKWLFDLEETEKGYKLLGLHPKLKKCLTLDENLRNRNIKPFTVFIDCLKDRPIAKEKVLIPGKTRIFSISPVQFTIQFKQYFIDFIAAYHTARLDAEHGIGMDIYSPEWNRTANYLLEKGGKIICGDYKNFGPSLMLEAARRAFDIIFSWYKLHGDEKNNAVRKIMAEEVLESVHLCSNLFYRTPAGIPSGSPITTPLNSMVNSLYIRCVWKLTTNLSFREMHQFCNILTYGDDVCIGVSDEVVEQFNTETMSQAFAQFRITFTDVDKSDTIIPYRTIDTAQFLKCNFVRHEFRPIWIAKIDESSISNCLNWIHKRNDLREATIQNCEQALELAHGWGRKYYNDLRDKIIPNVRSIGQLRVSSWLEVDDRRYGVMQITPYTRLPDYNLQT